MLPGASWPWCHANVPAQVLIQQAQWGKDLKARALGNGEGLFVSGGSRGECVVDQGRKHGQWWLTQTVVACTDIGGSRREGHAQQWEVLGQEGA